MPCKSNIEKKQTSEDKDFLQKYKYLKKNTDYDVQNINLNKQLDEKSKKLLIDTSYLQLSLIGTIGVLYLLPSSITKWKTMKLL